MLARLVSEVLAETKTEINAFIPVTLIGEAVFARCLSAIKDERIRASKVIAGPQKEPFRGDKKQFIDDLEQALYASKIISYTQGFMLMRETAQEVSISCKATAASTSADTVHS